MMIFFNSSEHPPAPALRKLSPRLHAVPQTGFFQKGTMKTLSLEEQETMRELDLKARILQAQLEGCYRQLWQAAQQQSMGQGMYRMSVALFDRTKDLMFQLGEILEEADVLQGIKKSEEEKRTIN